MEAVTRWSLGEQFKKLGRKAEAREQLEQAVSIQQSMVDKRRGDEQLLGRLKDALAEIGPE